MAVRAGTQAITFAAPSGTSSAFGMRAPVAVGLLMPAAFTGSTLSFQVGVDGTTFSALYDAAGAAVVLPVTQGRAVAMPAGILPWPYCRVVSNSTEGTARTLTVVVAGGD